MKKVMLFLLLVTLSFGATSTKVVSTTDKIKQLEQENTDLKKKLSFYYQELPDKGKSLEKLTPEQEYIKNFVEIYEVDIAYHDFYSGESVGVRYKIKNKGNKTLQTVDVLIKYKDKDGNTIYEKTLYPVFSSDWSFGENMSELKPNYIYQMEKDKYTVDEKVPTEWVGAYDIEISKIEFKE